MVSLKEVMVVDDLKEVMVDHKEDLKVAMVVDYLKEVMVDLKEVMEVTHKAINPKVPY